MAWIEVREEATWEGAVLSLPHNHILQSYAWGEFKSRHGWEARRFLWPEGGAPRAAAQVLIRKLGPARLAYIPRGPVLDYSDAQLLEEVLAGLEEIAHREGAIFLKLDPEWPEEAEGVRALLSGRGWRPGEEVQFKNTVLVDLKHSEEEMLAAMKAKTRYNVRLALKRGVEVHPGEAADLPLFYRMYQETSARDHFVIRPFAYYRDLWEDFLRKGLAKLFLARYEGETLAGLILFRYGERSWYMYGASTDKHRNLMPNNALQWEAMRWAQAQGLRSYDLWGAPYDLEDAEDPMAGVHRFKMGFGGEVARFIGAHDYPAKAPLYWLYSEAMPKLLALMRRAYYSRRAAPPGPS